MRIIMANGCFDLLHAGHISHLEEAKAMGEILIVALTLDANVNKGPNRPIYEWADRAYVLNALRCVDRVVPSGNVIDAILEWKPQIFVKGRDYAATRFGDDLLNACRQTGTEIRITKSPKMSASDAIRKALLV